MNTGLYIPELYESLEARGSAAIHKLKGPLSEILNISNAIFSITDLTPEEFYEYSHQIRSNAHRMHEIINSVLLDPESTNTEMS